MGEENGVSNGSGEKATTAVAAGTPAPAEDIVKQVEYYFGDHNLSRDKFLLGEIAKNEGGWVDMSIMMKFNRLSKLADHKEDVVMDALAAVEEGDGLMEVDREAKRIRRKLSRPLPADREEYLAGLASRTVYVKGFDKDMELDQVSAVFEPHGPVESIFMRRWKADPGVKNFKGTCLVTFPDVAAAEKFLAVPEVKCGDVVLTRMWKNDWALEKEEQNKARRERIKQSKLEKKQGKGKDKDKKDKTEAKSPPKKRKFDEDGEEKDESEASSSVEKAPKKQKTGDDEEKEAGGDGQEAGSSSTAAKDKEGEDAKEEEMDGDDDDEDEDED